MKNIITDHSLKIVLSIGDESGVGPEIILKSLNSHQVPKNIDIYLVDTYGETEKFFNLIKIVFVGGSLVNHGGQNPLEPARHGCNILYGPYVNNFKKIYDYLDKIQVSKKIRGDKSLFKNIELLISNKSKGRSVIRRVSNLGDRISKFVIKEIESSIIK